MRRSASPAFLAAVRQAVLNIRRVRDFVGSTAPVLHGNVVASSGNAILGVVVTRWSLRVDWLGARPISRCGRVVDACFSSFGRHHRGRRLCHTEQHCESVFCRYRVANRHEHHSRRSALEHPTSDALDRRWPTRGPDSKAKQRSSVCSPGGASCLVCRA
jgi:hypothetical protein